MKKTLSIVGVLVAAPGMALAQTLIPVTDANSLILKFQDIINSAVWVLVSLAVIFIVWNTLQFIRHAGSEDRAKYQNAILWGIVGLFVILSIWGLVNILRNTFSIGNAYNQGSASLDTQSLIINNPALSNGVYPVR